MKSEKIIYNSENPIIILSPELPEEKLFIEHLSSQNEVLKFEVEMFFERKSGINQNHRIIIHKKERSQDDFPFVIDDSIEKESNTVFKQHLITIAILLVLLLLGYFVSNFPSELVGFATFIFLYIAIYQLVKAFL